MGQKLTGAPPPYWREEQLGLHVTQCGQDRGLPACQIVSWSIQPFGHSTPTSQTDRTDRQRSDSRGGGEPFKQTVAQKFSDQKVKLGY